MTSSTAARTLPQLRPTISASAFHRLRPARPVKLSMPPASVPRLGLPLKNFVTVVRSHTDPIEETISIASATVRTDFLVGFSASNSSTAIRS